jgi:hypothetical protein
MSGEAYRCKEALRILDPRKRPFGLRIFNRGIHGLDSVAKRGRKVEERGPAYAEATAWQAEVGGRKIRSFSTHAS